jgi:hypothetical protein
MQPQPILNFWFTELTPKHHFAKDAAFCEPRLLNRQLWSIALNYRPYAHPKHSVNTATPFAKPQHATACPTRVCLVRLCMAMTSRAATWISMAIKHMFDVKTPSQSTGWNFQQLGVMSCLMPSKRPHEHERPTPQSDRGGHCWPKWCRLAGLPVAYL